METFGTLKYRLENEDFNLEAMKRKISNAYAWDEITEEQYGELMGLANKNAKPDGMTADLQTQIDALAARVLALEEGGSGSKDEPGEDIQEWKPWDGATRPLPYQVGSKVKHKGKTWESKVANNIWEPGAVGVGANIWAEV